MGSKTSGETKGKNPKKFRYSDLIIIYSPFKLRIGARVRYISPEEEAKVVEKILEEHPKEGQKPLTPEERKRIARQTVGLKP